MTIIFKISNLIANRASYVYNYPRPEGSTTINPIRFAIVIAHDFVQNYHGLITQINRFDLFYPVNLTLAVSNLALVIYAVYKRKYILALFIVGFMIYSNVRSNPLESKETDYQAAVYIVMSLFNGVFVVRKLHEDINFKNEQLATKVVFSALLIGTGVLVLFNSYYMFRKFFDKSYEKYMGTASTIYDRPQFAPIINAVVNQNDYMWIGPFEFEELFYANGKFPSKYHILIPGMRQQPAVIQQVMSDFEKNKPKVIYFNRQYHVLGMEPSQYAPWFLSFLDSNYITLVNYREDGYQYRSVKGIDLSYDPEAKLYINKDNLREVIDKLLGANIIKKVAI
jgi:hypothetical protein